MAGTGYRGLAAARHRGRPVRLLRRRHGEVEAGGFRGHRHGRSHHLRLIAMASRHDHYPRGDTARRRAMRAAATALAEQWTTEDQDPGDRKSTRLNSSH